MDSYSVKQIAELLSTSQETVRRWIREGRLEATVAATRKEGSTVSRAQLAKFLEETPKYASIAAKSAKASPAVALSLVLGSVVGGIIAARLDEKDKGNDLEVSTDDIKAHLMSEAKAYENMIEEHRNSINRLRREIADAERQIEVLRSALGLLEDASK